MEYGITANGFSMRRLDEIYNASCKRFEDEIGVNPSENPQSVMNVLFTIFSDAPAEMWEAFAASYQQLFPNTAEGIALDNAMQIGGVNRIGQARTKYTLSCTGREGTIIPAGALVQSSTYPQRQFRAKGVSTISSANWKRIGIRPIESVSGTIAFEFGVSRNATSGEVGSYSESASITKQLSVSSYSDAYTKILAELQKFDALTKFGIKVEDSTDAQGNHTIVLSASGAADSFSASLCRYITVVDVTSNILFESVEYGSYVQADKTIDQIVTTVDGWHSCINEIPPIKGRLTQKDSEARASYTNRVASRGTGTVNAIVSLLYSDVEGVTFAAGYQNDNDEKDTAGRPPHCIHAKRVFEAVYNDYAELMPRGEDTEPGDIIALDTNSRQEKYVKATNLSSRIAGIHSDEYGMLIGGERVNDGEDFLKKNLPRFIPVSLAGRVHTKVIGPVNTGDCIVLSHIPGVGRAAKPCEYVDPCKVVGYAVEGDNLTEQRRLKVRVRGA